MKYTTSILSTMLILAIAAACSKNPSSPEPEPNPTFGIIEVEVVTAGDDDDPDGYTVSVQGGEMKEIGPNGTVTFNQVATGNKTVTLSGLPVHCTLDGSPSQAFTLGDNEVRTITFEVTCTAIFRDKILFLRNTGVQLEYQIYSMDPDGNNMRMISDMILFSNSTPSASPDGLKVIFVETNSQVMLPQIWVQNSDGSGLQNLTDDPSKSHSAPAWSPDGSKIAFAAVAAGDGNRSDIFIMDSDGSNVVNITNNPDAHDNNPSWSPDGNELVFSSVRPNPSGGNLFSIAKINVNGTGRNTIIEEEGFLSTNPKWSPDGSKIAYERFEQFTQNPRQIHLMNPDGSNVRNITAEGGSPNLATFKATWSPDGNNIAFHSSIGTAFNILIMNANGEIQAGITNGADGQHHLSPSWSPFSRN